MDERTSERRCARCCGPAGPGGYSRSDVGYLPMCSPCGDRVFEASKQIDESACIACLNRPASNGWRCEVCTGPDGKGPTHPCRTCGDPIPEGDALCRGCVPALEVAEPPGWPTGRWDVASDGSLAGVDHLRSVLDYDRKAGRRLLPPPDLRSHPGYEGEVRREPGNLERLADEIRKWRPAQPGSFRETVQDLRDQMRRQYNFEQAVREMEAISPGLSDFLRLGAGMTRADYFGGRPIGRVMVGARLIGYESPGGVVTIPHEPRQPNVPDSKGVGWSPPFDEDG